MFFNYDQYVNQKILSKINEKCNINLKWRKRIKLCLCYDYMFLIFKKDVLNLVFMVIIVICYVLLIVEKIGYVIFSLEFVLSVNLDGWEYFVI